MSGQVARGQVSSRNKKWGEEILTGLLEKAPPGRVIVIRDGQVKVDRSGEAGYAQRQAGEGEGEPDK